MAVQHELETVLDMHPMHEEEGEEQGLLLEF
jgi:hypothetical protein